MEDFLDVVWVKILTSVQYIKTFLDFTFSPLNSLGPAFSIFAIAFITIIITKVSTITFKTKRYKKLKKEFRYWYNIRQEALKCEDSEKAKLLAKNIDQAKLNRAYYDYFFEAFLNSLLTKYLPIFSSMAYINESYKAGNLLKLFGKEYVFKFKNLNGEEIVVGSVFWFVISILLVYSGWFLVKRIYTAYHSQEKKAGLNSESI